MASRQLECEMTGDATHFHKAMEEGRLSLEFQRESAAISKRMVELVSKAGPVKLTHRQRLARWLLR